MSESHLREIFPSKTPTLHVWICNHQNPKKTKTLQTPGRKTSLSITPPCQIFRKSSLWVNLDDGNPLNSSVISQLITPQIIVHCAI